MTPTVCESTLPLGATLVKGGVAFRVWAPNADRVAVVGDFNEWADDRAPLAEGEGGVWQGWVEGASPGDLYGFVIWNGELRLERTDPYAREMTNSIGKGVVVDPAFDWQGDSMRLADLNRLVIYEMHVGTFHRTDSDLVGTFSEVIDKLDYLKWLGVNAIELMPASEFAGDVSWGYNPAHLFAVESAYGGPRALKKLVLQAHKRQIGVLLDVVYNHLGPSDVGVWQFDGWAQDGNGGIYFYNDDRRETPWGDTRPDYGRGEVRRYLFENAMMWLDEYRMDGLRYDATLYMRTIDGSVSRELHDGWSLVQWINRKIRARYPRKITIAEDLQNHDALTKPDKWGGANFHSQWDAQFVHPVRAVLTSVEDSDRSMAAVREALVSRYNYDAFERVIYTESHDEVANGKSRVPSEIDARNPSSWAARKRATLGLCLTLTAPGIPMLFQGQEFLRTGWFDDTDPIDWSRIEEQPGVVRLVRDLIALRLDRNGFTAGLTGQRIEVYHINDYDKVIAYRRWLEGGAGDETLCVANFSHRVLEGYRIGVLWPGKWRLRLNSDAPCYGPAEDPARQDSRSATDFSTDNVPYDFLTYSAVVRLQPYSMLVFSQDSP